MFRVVNLSRAQPAARNLLLINKRYQQSSTSSGSSTTQSTTKNPSSTASSSNNPTKTTTTPPPSTPPPSSKTVPPPSSSSSYPSSGSSGISGTVKAIVYGVALGLGVTLIYAEYDNGSFRRKVESTLPLSPTILSGLDKIIDPVFGRQKKLTTIISENLPDISPVTDRLPDKDQIKKAGEQIKDAANAAYNKLPSQQQIEKAGEKAKDAINDAYDKLPEYKKVKGAVTHAADQVKLL
jgi:tetrahydromethanopterin S-methyltransferase subunit B